MRTCTELHARRTSMPLIISLALALAVPAVPVLAARAIPTPHVPITRTWTGATSVNWSDDGNWDTGHPVSGDSVVFPQGASNTTNNNDIANLSLVDIHVSGTTTTYALSGNAITLTGSIVDDPAGSTSMSFDIAMPSTIAITTTTTSSRLFLPGNISGAGGITAGGHGELHLSGANSYTGAVVGNGGYVFVDSATALGTTAGGTTINAGSTLAFEVPNPQCEAFTVTGLGQSNNGALQVYASAGNALSCNVTLGNGNTRATAITPNTVTLSGVISGVGPFEFGGDGVMILTNPANNWTGGLTFNTGFSGTLRLGASNVIPSNAQVTLNSSYTLDLNGFSNTIASLTGPGTLALGTGTLTLNQSATTTFDGTVTGAGTIAKQGSGVITFTGARTGGGVSVSAGTVFVDASWSTTLAGVSGTGVIGGSGGVDTTTLVGGAISPGHSPGHFGVGLLTFPGGASASLIVELNGLAAGTQYDQVQAAGGVQLNGATLNATLGFAAPNGSQFTIIQNDAGGPVSGTFAGLPEGAALMISGSPFTISYAAGDGNDVVLTAGAAAVPTMRPLLWLVLTIATLGAAAIMLGRRRAFPLAR